MSPGTPLSKLAPKVSAGLLGTDPPPSFGSKGRLTCALEAARPPGSVELPGKRGAPRRRHARAPPCLGTAQSPCGGAGSAARLQPWVGVWAPRAAPPSTRSSGRRCQDCRSRSSSRSERRRRRRQPRCPSLPDNDFQFTCRQPRGMEQRRSALLIGSRPALLGSAGPAGAGLRREPRPRLPFAVGARPFFGPPLRSSP